MLFVLLELHLILEMWLEFTKTNEDIIQNANDQT